MCDFHECLVGPHIPGNTETSGSTLPKVRQLLTAKPRTELRTLLWNQLFVTP